MSRRVVFIVLFAVCTVAAACAPPTASPPTTSTSTTSTTMPPTATADISAGQEHTCVALVDQTVRCWGNGNWGKLGTDQNVANHPTPVAVVELADSTGVEVGGNVSCSLVEASGTTMRCWGYNGYNQLLTNATYLDRPRAIPGPYATAATVAHRHTCILVYDAVVNGKVSCWGSNTGGQLGHGSYGVTMHGSGWVNGVAGATLLDAGHSYTCAVLADETVRCWGGSNPPTSVPVADVSDAVRLSVGGDMGCVVRSDSKVVCWGGGTSGNPASAGEVVAGVDDAVDVSVGEGHACVLRTGGAVACWGSGARGELGNGASVDSAAPVPVSGLSDAVAVAAGGSHTCAVRVGGSVTCWGSALQLGNASTFDSNTPVPVAAF